MNNQIKKTDKFYHSKAWTKKRIFVLQRDKYLCQELYNEKCANKGIINK